jgi:Uncharacterized conserved protein
MQKISKKFCKKHKIIAAVSAAALILAILAVVHWWDSLSSVFINRTAIHDYIQSAGIFGPIVFILLQIVQVVIAPIPGQATSLVGGYAFGLFGLIYSIVGITVGFTLVFIIARKFGRPLIEKLFDKKLIKKFDYITESKGTLVLFLIFLLPTFPDDLICYLAGMTKIPIKKLLVVSVAGRLPGFLVLNLVGSGFTTSSNIRPTIAIIIATMIILAITYWKRSWLSQFAKSNNQIEFVKENWKLNIAQTASIIIATILIATALCLFALYVPMQK